MPDYKTRPLFILFIILAYFIFIPVCFSRENAPSLVILDVVPVNVEDSKAAIVSGYIIDKVHKTGAYKIVERKEIDKALEEIEFSLSGLVDDNTAIKIGKFIGAQFVLISSLSYESDVYFLSMRVINVSSGEVSETSMKSGGDFKKVEKLVVKAVKYLLESKPGKRYQMGIGMSTSLAVPLGEAAGFLTTAFEPCLFYQFRIITDSGIIALAGGGSFSHYNVEEQPDSLVNNIPLFLSADYIYFLKKLILFVGCKGGMVISGYKASTMSEVEWGFVPFVSPGLGIGMSVVDWLEIAVGARLDMIFLDTDYIHMNINPFIGINLLF